MVRKLFYVSSKFQRFNEIPSLPNEIESMKRRVLAEE
jgi:hypothetical protein